MDSRDRGTRERLRGDFSREALGALRQLREIFALEIQDLESSCPECEASARVLPNTSLGERSYERLLRLRRIHAKLHNRERVLTESRLASQE